MNYFDPQSRSVPVRCQRAIYVHRLNRRERSSPRHHSTLIINVSPRPPPAAPSRTTTMISWAPACRSKAMTTCDSSRCATCTGFGATGSWAHRLSTPTMRFSGDGARRRYFANARADKAERRRHRCEYLLGLPRQRVQPARRLAGQHQQSCVSRLDRRTKQLRYLPDILYVTTGDTATAMCSPSARTINGLRTRPPSAYAPITLRGYTFGEYLGKNMSSFEAGSGFTCSAMDGDRVRRHRLPLWRRFKVY